MFIHLLAYYIGILIVLASHIYLLVKMKKTPMTLKEMQYHSYINMAAVFLIAYYFTNKEGYISF